MDDPTQQGNGQTASDGDAVVDGISDPTEGATAATPGQPEADENRRASTLTSETGQTDTGHAPRSGEVKAPDKPLAETTEATEEQQES